MQPLQAGAQQLSKQCGMLRMMLLSVSLGEGTILTWSRSAERFTSTRKATFFGRFTTSLGCRCSRHNEAALLAQSIVLGQRVEGFESEHLTQSGKPGHCVG
jgi:hypothetical protein